MFFGLFKSKHPKQRLLEIKFAYLERKVSILQSELNILSDKYSELEIEQKNDYMLLNHQVSLLNKKVGEK